MKTILLISTGNQWIFLGITAFILMFGIAAIAYAISSAECYEFDEDPVDIPGNDYDYCERPYYGD
jgi:hypothetical protein